MSPAFARFVYSTLLRLLTPAYFVRLWWRGRSEPAYRQHWGERLGAGGPRAAPGAVWVHAVSLGETKAAAALIDVLRQVEPGLKLLLTHGTATGRDAGKALLKPGDTQVWLPFDTPGAVGRFLLRHRPLVGVLMETETWPNLLHAAQSMGLPMVLANARLSEKSRLAGERWASLIEPAVRSLALVLAQTETDAWRLRRAGARQVRVCGNIKFDVTPPAKLLARGLQWRQALARPVVLAASTREGEELMLLQAWMRLPLPRPLLLIVPRHPQRFDEVAEIARGFGLKVRRRSHMGDVPPDDVANADVWLGDTLGEMPLYYGVADVALLGGSFAPLGGQNLIEAAACGCPLVMGPSTFNFADAAELALAAGAAIRVKDIDAGVAQAVSLVSDPARNDWVRNAFEFAAAHRGAAKRMVGELLALLTSRKPRQ